jgi:hypothetical protein
MIAEIVVAEFLVEGESQSPTKSPESFDTQG